MELEVVNEGEYLHITFSGRFSADAGKQVVDEMVAAAMRERCTRILFDCRPMTGALKVLDRFEVGAYGATKLRGAIKVAVLARKDQILPDNFFENVARNRGALMSVFSEIGEAIAWLRE